jgi:arginine decarboxylase
MMATMSFADDRHTVDRLIDALTAWRQAARDFDRPLRIHLPSPDEIELETVILPVMRSSGRPRWFPPNGPRGK